MKDKVMQDKIKRFKEVKGAKFVWVDKDNVVHYLEKEKFDAAITIAEKGVNVAIRVMIINGATLIIGGPVYAGTFSEGLQPIINMIADCAEPITYGYMIKGFLKLTQGKEEEAKTVIKNAGAGFLGVKFIPQIIHWLGGINLGL